VPIRKGDVPWKPILAAAGTFLGVVGIATVANRKSAPPSPAPTPTSSRVALLGDSYAVGLGPQLQRLLPLVQYEGHVGMGTTGWAACSSCGNWLPAFKPTLTLVSLGVNDGSAPNRTNYQLIVSALHGIGTRVVWIEPPAQVSVPGVNMAAIRATIASLGVPTVPATQTPLAAEQIRGQTAYLHPQSYVPWANEIVRAITQQGGVT
jgi:hypothetical protein